MKKLALATTIALAAMASATPYAVAGSYDEGDSYASDQAYDQHEYRHCWWKSFKWYDAYGKAHWKRVKVCG